MCGEFNDNANISKRRSQWSTLQELALVAALRASPHTRFVFVRPHLKEPWASRGARTGAAW